MSLTERKKEILRTVVEQYVDTAEPVGSKTVVQQLGTAVSAATVRNEMAELVELGLLEQPHTSAGRIPSPAGYRLYVNELMRSHKLSQDDTREISSSLNLLHTAGQEQSLIDEAGRLTSRLTTYPAYALSSMTGDITIARFDLIYVDSFTFIIVVLLSNDLVKNKLVHITSPLQQPQLVKLS
ncbi:MAG: heat-inducible transcription repressor HrcA, partial [Oscillospiraceae bacterium]|nr:heat-inducible transcription repressor HrcA [Oscillospiraceae bacterium]